MRVGSILAAVGALVSSCGGPEGLVEHQPAAVGPEGGDVDANGGGGSPGYIDASGIPIFDAPPWPDQCPWTYGGGEAGSGGDPHCDGSWSNDPACPPTQPDYGTDCEGFATCWYPTSALGGVREECDQSKWHETVFECAEDCSKADGAAGIAVGGTCGAEDVSCGEESFHEVTDLEQLRPALGQVAQCCGAMSEFLATVTFEGGCATSVQVAVGGPWEDHVEQCIANSLAGKRINCALGQACVTIVFTTLR